MEKSYLMTQSISTMATILLIVVASLVCLHTADADIGACYGILGNLPPPSEVITLCNQHSIHRIRLYDPNPSVLNALRGHKSIAVMLGVVNNDIPGIAQDANIAKSWVQNNVVRYHDVNIKYVTVGNEILPTGDMYTIATSIPQAMLNLQNALSDVGLSGSVKVSTVLSMGVLGKSYPPSAGAFNPDYYNSFIRPILQFLGSFESPFLINIYPYFTHISDPVNVALDYALFTSPSSVVTDGPHQYQNLFDAMLDAVHAALEKGGGANLVVQVTETGWPSDGGTATSVGNARTYNTNLVQSVKKGTPRRPGKPIVTYIFDLIDENQKSPELEKHWGVFYANKQPKYPLSFT